MIKRAFTAALWFSLAALLAGLASLAAMGTVGMGCMDVSMAVTAALAAFVPALVLGAPIGDRKSRRPALSAVFRGFVIVACSYALLPAMAIVTGRPGAPSDFGGMGCTVIMFVFLGGVITGWITYPAGGLAGFVLYKLRTRERRPKACAVHGYRLHSGLGQNAR